METVLLAIHVIVAVLLVGVILIQRGQGADMGVSFGGGGAQTLFGSRGSGSFLGKMTGALAAIFMTTSLSLAFFTQQETGSIIESGIVPVQSLPASDGAATTEAPAGFDPAALKDEGASSRSDVLPAAE
ncbi:MAG: preprotein translocase subunit SecG [Mariprofundaceae bacterium]|nr:preprotein translocase subunit SecG [Mariprofundaceae bacterium]